MSRLGDVRRCVLAVTVIAVFLGFLSVSRSSWAGAISGSFYPYGVTIGWGGEGLYIYLAEDLNGCGSTLGILRPTEPMYKESFSAYMLAYTMDRQITVYAAGCDGTSNRVVTVQIPGGQ